MNTTMRTLVFGIHNPSRRTRALLLRAIRSCHAGLAALLDAAQRDWPTLRPQVLDDKGRVQEGALAMLLHQRYVATVGERRPGRLARYPIHGSLREGVVATAATMLHSYDRLRQRWERQRAYVATTIAEKGWMLEPVLHKEAARLLEALGEPPSYPRLPPTRAHPARYEGELERFATQLVLPEDPQEAPLQPRGKVEVKRPTRAAKRRERGDERYKAHCCTLVARDGAPIVGLRPRPAPDEVLRRRLSVEVTPWTAPPVRPTLRLARLVQPRCVPAVFARADAAPRSRNFALLRSAHDGRYYALLYLLPKDDAHCAPFWPKTPRVTAPTTPRQSDGQIPREVAIAKQTRNRHGALRDIYHPTKGARADADPTVTWVERSDRTSTALCLPLACGAWHEETLRAALEHPQMVRVARLLHIPARRTGGGERPEQFRLAITFEWPCAPPRPVEHDMGVAMDAFGRLAYVVRERATGVVKEQGTDTDLLAGIVTRANKPPTLWELREGWRAERRMSMEKSGRLPARLQRVQAEQVEHVLHHLSNAIVDKACQYNAQIGLQDVSYLRNSRPPVARNPDGSRVKRSAEWHEQARTAQYRRATLNTGTLLTQLRYKAQREGLPRPISLRGISPYDCATCNERTKRVEGQPRPTYCRYCDPKVEFTVGNTAFVVTRAIPEALERIAVARRARRSVEDEEDVSAPGDDIVEDGAGD